MYAHWSCADEPAREPARRRDLVGRERHEARAAGALHEAGREIGEDHREAERHQREVQPLHAQRREPDERADHERDDGDERQRRDERHVAERDAEPVCTDGPSATR